MKTRILIVDDSPLVRKRLRDLLQRHLDWEVCGEFGDDVDVVQKAKELSPDIIVLDLFMPGTDGLQTARRIGRMLPDIPILMFTMHSSRQLLAEAKNAGIRGVVSKSDSAHVVEGLEALLRNETYFAAPAPINYPRQT